MPPCCRVVQLVIRAMTGVVRACGRIRAYTATCQHSSCSGKVQGILPMAVQAASGRGVTPRVVWCADGYAQAAAACPAARPQKGCGGPAQDAGCLQHGAAGASHALWHLQLLFAQQAHLQGCKL